MSAGVGIAKLWERVCRAASGLVKPGRALAMLCATLFASATLARSLEVPSADVWAKGEPLTWALVGVGLVTGIAGVLNLRSARSRTRDLRLAEGCRLVAAHVDDRCGNIALKHVDVTVWRVGGPWLGRHLVRVQDFVLGERLQSSGITWVRGKGVIGHCWKHETAVFMDLENEFYSRANDEVTWNALGEAERLALSWRELNDTRHYEAIWAAPLRSAHRVQARVVAVVCVGLRAADPVGGGRPIDRAAELERGLMAIRKAPDGTEQKIVQASVSGILDRCERAFRGVE